MFAFFLHWFRSPTRRTPRRSVEPSPPNLRQPRTRYRPCLEELETRLAPATLVDLTNGTTELVNSGGVTAIYSSNDVIVGAGTGLLDPFDRISTNQTTEQGYNTDFPQVVLDNAAKGGTNFVHSLRLNDLPITIVNGVAYYRFELDINEPNNAGNLLSLDAVQIWQASVGDLGNYLPGANPDQGTGAFPAATGATLRYNLDAPGLLGGVVVGDKFIGLNGDLQSGSGNTVDMSLAVPVSAFDPSQTFVYLYSAFGFQGSTWINDSGFEEWNRQIGQVIDGYKFNDLNADGVWNLPDELPLNGWTIYIDVNNNNKRTQASRLR